MIQRLERLLNRKVCVVRPTGISVIGYLSTSGCGSKYLCWDAGSTVTFDDNDIDFVEINFIHLKQFAEPTAKPDASTG